MQHEHEVRSGVSLIRDRSRVGIRHDPGSAAHDHSASKTRVNALMALRPGNE